MIVNFSVMGPPVGKGRARSGKGGRHYTPERTRLYEDIIRMEYLQSVNKRFPDVPLYMLLSIYCPIPKTYKKKKVTTEMVEQMLKHALRPMSRPDNSNILKSCEDALNKLAYADDSQITETLVRRFYSDKPRVEITISDGQF